MSIFRKIKGAIRNSTTYRVGLLQAKAYKVLKDCTREALLEYGISTVEWALLGLLHDNKEGFRSSQLALELGVEAPFVTALFGNLKKMDLVDSKADASDSRAKIMHLTSTGHAFVSKTESRVRDLMRPAIKDIPHGDLLSYVSVLEKIIENSEKEKEKGQQKD